VTKARDIADFKFENIVDTGTAGTKVASGTTSQRGTTTGQWRYNTETGFFEGRNATGNFSTLEPTPTVTGVDVTEVQSAAGGNQTFVITGTNFASGAVASFVGSSAQFDATTTTVDSATQITAVAPKASFLNAQEPYSVKVTSASGLAGTSASGLINVDNAPSWTTNAGSLGSIVENATGNHFTVAATDPEGDTVSYSLQSGSLAGLSLDSSTGVISGDPTDVTSDTTNSFTLRATAGGKTSDRAFSYVTQNFVVTSPNQIPENIWQSIPTGTFSNNSTYTDYYGGRFEVLSGNIMKFMQQYSSEHVMYNRANCRSNSNEECYIQLYDIQTNLAQTSGNAYVQFGLVYDDPTNISTNNNTMFGYVSGSYDKARYVVFGDIDASTNHGFYQGAPRAQNDASISNATNYRDSLQSIDLDSYQLSFTPTSASTRTAITFVVKPDNHSSNARKVYVFYGNTKVHTFSNLVPASSPIHFYIGIGHNTDNSGGDNWTNNPPRLRYADNNGSAEYDVGG
jgi:hypothetical protein